jgi:hypothetical protein
MRRCTVRWMPGLRARLVACLAGAGLTVAAGAATAVDLERVNAWSVEGPDNLQLSGLALRDGVLFTVSDKHSDTVFRVEMSGQTARCVPAVSFTGPDPLPLHGWLDLEAIVPASDGGFILASEEAVRLLRVPAGGGVATWITPDLRPEGQVVGLFARHNAHNEGLVLLGEDWFLVAAEREPRGLVEIVGRGLPVRVCAQEMNSSKFPVDAGRKVDFADLFRWRGRVFALARNQHLVVELVRKVADGSWREGDTAWSYAATENSPAFGYGGTPFGLAEGLAIDDELIYIVVDNGGEARAGRPDDRRPWLWGFRNVLGR